MARSRESCGVSRGRAKCNKTIGGMPRTHEECNSRREEERCEHRRARTVNVYKHPPMRLQCWLYLEVVVFISFENTHARISPDVYLGLKGRNVRCVLRERNCASTDTESDDSVRTELFIKQYRSDEKALGVFLGGEGRGCATGKGAGARTRFERFGVFGFPNDPGLHQILHSAASVKQLMPLEKRIDYDHRLCVATIHPELYIQSAGGCARGSQGKLR